MKLIFEVEENENRQGKVISYNLAANIVFKNWKEYNNTDIKIGGCPEEMQDGTIEDIFIYLERLQKWELVDSKKTIRNEYNKQKRG